MVVFLVACVASVSEDLSAFSNYFSSFGCAKIGATEKRGEPLSYHAFYSFIVLSDVTIFFRNPD